MAERPLLLLIVLTLHEYDTVTLALDFDFPSMKSTARKQPEGEFA